MRTDKNDKNAHSFSVSTLFFMNKLDDCGQSVIIQFSLYVCACARARVVLDTILGLR